MSKFPESHRPIILVPDRSVARLTKNTLHCITLTKNRSAMLHFKKSMRLTAATALRAAMHRPCLVESPAICPTSPWFYRTLIDGTPYFLRLFRPNRIRTTALRAAIYRPCLGDLPAISPFLVYLREPIPGLPKKPAQRFACFVSASRLVLGAVPPSKRSGVQFRRYSAAQFRTAACRTRFVPFCGIFAAVSSPFSFIVSAVSRRIIRNF